MQNYIDEGLQNQDGNKQCFLKKNKKKSKLKTINFLIKKIICLDLNNNNYQLPAKFFPMDYNSCQDYYNYQLLAKFFPVDYNSCQNYVLNFSSLTFGSQASSLHWTQKRE